MKLCKDCKFYKPEMGKRTFGFFLEAQCKHPNHISPVTGKQWTMDCEQYRRHLKSIPESCGPDAKYFEATP